MWTIIEVVKSSVSFITEVKLSGVEVNPKHNCKIVKSVKKFWYDHVVIVYYMWMAQKETH